MLGIKQTMKTAAGAAIVGAAMMASSAGAGTITNITLGSNVGGSATIFSGSHDLGTMGPLNVSFSGAQSSFTGVNFKDITNFTISMVISGTPLSPGFTATGSLAGTYAGGVPFPPFSFIGLFTGGISASGSGTSVLSFNLPVVDDGITVFPGVLTPITALSGTLNVTPVPIPAAVVLFGSGLLGLVGMRKLARRREEGAAEAAA